MPYPRAAAYGNKKGHKTKPVANTPPRRLQAEDVPLGNGLAGQAKKALQSRQERIDALVKAGGG